MNQQMHIQLYMFFITSITYMLQLPSTTIFRVYSINIRTTIEVLYDEILQDLVPCKNGTKSLKSLSNHYKNMNKDMVMCLGREISNITIYFMT
jgi:hypothetical protein